MRTASTNGPNGWVEPLSPSEGPGRSARGLRDVGTFYAPATVEEMEIRIRWRDVDNYGHVNNAVYLTYLEECRDRWVRGTVGAALEFVIVRIAIDYRRELSLEDRAVLVSCRGIGHGTSSIRTAETIRAEAGWTAAESESVVVAHDPVARKAVPLTEQQRDAVDASIAADAAALSSGGSGGRT